MDIKNYIIRLLRGNATQLNLSEYNEKIAISAGNHKYAALTFDKIVPMHSELSVPVKFTADLNFPRTGEESVDEIILNLVEMIDSIAKSPFDNVYIKHGGIFFDILEKNEAYKSIFISDEREFNNICGVFEWIRDIATLLAYEISTLFGHKVTPIFNNSDVLLKFMKHGGLFLKPDGQGVDYQVIEIVQHNIIEIMYDSTEWSQIKELEKDMESYNIMKAYNRILKGNIDKSEPERLKDEIDERILKFETVLGKYNIQYKKVKRHIFLDVISAGTFGSLSLYSALLGLPSAIPLAALIGASVATSKALFSLKEQRISMRPNQTEIASYLSDVKSIMKYNFPNGNITIS